MRKLRAFTPRFKGEYWDCGWIILDVIRFVKNFYFCCTPDHPAYSLCESFVEHAFPLVRLQQAGNPKPVNRQQQFHFAEHATKPNMRASCLSLFSRFYLCFPFSLSCCSDASSGMTIDVGRLFVCSRHKHYALIAYSATAHRRTGWVTEWVSGLSVSLGERVRVRER